MKNKFIIIKNWITLVFVITINLLGELYNTFDIYEPPRNKETEEKLRDEKRSR